jgi:hypothetical protein
MITSNDIKHPGTYDEYLRNRGPWETYSQYIRRMGYVKTVTEREPYVVLVRYSLTTDKEATDYVQRVAIHPGYTTEDDIPKIVAVSRARHIEEIDVQSVTGVKP